MEYTINVIWDSDAEVWVATSDDIPGLVLESDSVDALWERVRLAAPELLVLNHQQADSCTLLFRSERQERITG